jgi:hypothetical protein
MARRARLASWLSLDGRRHPRRHALVHDPEVSPCDPPPQERPDPSAHKQHNNHSDPRRIAASLAPPDIDEPDRLKPKNIDHNKRD